MGQHLDSKFNYLKNPDSFTEKNYYQMSIYKTSHYTFRFPILLALIHSQKGNEKSYKIVDDICDEIGINLQIQVSLFFLKFIKKNTNGLAVWTFIVNEILKFVNWELLIFLS